MIGGTESLRLVGIGVALLGALACPGREVSVESEGAPLQAGDRVFVTGGFEMDPEWLGGREGYSGTIERFIPGQNEDLAAVVRTDSPVSVGDVTGDVLVMELRWVGATWRSDAVAHIELCDFEPAARPWQHRRQGTWIESHASIRHLE